MREEVTIEITPWLSKAVGKTSKVTLTEPIRKGEQLKAVLERIAGKHEAFGAMIYDVHRGTLYDAVVIFVNNRPIAKDLQYSMQGGDTIVLTPFYSGG
jgi:molybdopterin converting factor small subunit